MRAFFTVALTLFAAASQAAVRFEPPLFLNKAASATSVAVADIDGDGALDVVAAVPDGIEIFYGDMRGGVRETEMIPMPARAQSIALSDLNRDGVTDIIATTSDGVWNVISEGRHYAAAQRAGKADSLVTKLIDINGVPGKVTMDGRSKALFLQIGNELQRTIELPDIVTSFAIADFDGDGKADIAASTLGSNRISILLGDGNGGFTATDSIDAGEVVLAIAAGDIDRNGHIDLVVAYAKGIAFIPNISQRPPRATPDRGGRIQSESLHAAPQSCFATLFFEAVDFDPTIGAYQWNDPNNWGELDANCVPDGVHRVPNANDFVSSSSNTNFPLAIVGSAIAGGISSNYLCIGSPHPVQGIGFLSGSLQIVGSQAAEFGTLQIETGSALNSSAQVVVSDLSMFGGSIVATGPQFNYAFQVSGSVLWEGGSLTTVGGGDAVFFADATVFGQVQLCAGTKLSVRSTLSLNGIIRPCPSGSGTLDISFATLNAVADNFPAIFSNFQGDTATVNVTGTGPLNIFGVSGFNPSQSLSRSFAHLGAGTTLNLGNSTNFFLGDGLTTDGLGTTVAFGLRGVTTVNNPLTVQGTLGSKPGDRADFTNANGPVTLSGNVIGHGLTINGSGSQLNHVCMGGGAIIDLHSDMTVAGPTPGISNCGGTGTFRVNFFGGSLTIPNSLQVSSTVEFEGDGTINLQGGILQVFGSPLGYKASGHFNLAGGTRFVTLGPFGLQGAIVSGDGVFETDDVFHSFGAVVANLKSFRDIDGPGLTITHDWEWMARGTVSGQVTIGSGATVNTSDGGTLNNSFFMVNGTMNTQSLCVMNGSTFNVNFGGTANISPPFGIIALGECGPPSGGSLRVNLNGTLVVNVTGRTAMVLPSTIGGYLHVTGNGPMTYLSPATFQEGFQPQVLVDGGAAIDFQQPVTFPFSNLQATGGGTISFTLTTLSGGPNFFGLSTIFNNATFLSGDMNLGFGTHSVPTTLFIQAGTVTIGGTLDLGTTGHVTNNGTMQIFGGQLNVASPGHAIVGSGSISNARLITGGSPAGTFIDNPITNGTFGRIVANSGSLTTLNLTNNSGGTLTGGFYEADGASTLNLGFVQNNAASLTANGGQLALNGLSANLPGGNITLVNGGSIFGSSFTNNGNVFIGAGSTFSAFGFTQAGGQTLLTDPTAQINAQTILQGGLLAGYGTITGSLQNLGGDLQPNINSNFNNHPGTMTVQGNYSEGAGSHLHMVINGQTNYSQLHVTGSVSLAGTLQLDPAIFDDGFGDQNFFFPNPGDAFKVLTFASRSGQFATLVGQDQTFIQNYIYGPHYNANDLTFIVETQDPKVLIGNLEGVIGSLGVDPSVVSSLNAKLDAALSALQRGDSTAACGQLGAALNFASAQSGKKLTQDQATMIINSVLLIRGKVGCK